MSAAEIIELPTATATRTEREMAADALVQLMVEGIVPTHARPVATAALCLVYDDVTAAIGRRHARGFVAPVDAPAASVASLPPADRYSAASRSTHRFTQSNPAAGMRRCAECHETLSEDRFHWKDRAKGYRKSYCIDCDRSRARARYLTTAREAALAKAGVRFTVEVGDDAADLVCTCCNEPIVIGDAVVVDVGISHERCSDAAQGGE